VSAQPPPQPKQTTIGSGERFPEIGKEAQGILAVLASNEASLKQQHVFAPTASFPLPDDAHACLYWRTPSGVFADQPRIADLESGKHRLSGLRDAMQDLLGHVMQKKDQ
jgi:hypothetical protein